VITAPHSVSLDGFIADADHRSDRLHGWLRSGGTPSRLNPSFIMPAVSARFFDQGVARCGAVIAGRRTHDVPGPVHWSGPRTRDGCFTGRALVSTCWQSSSGCRAANVTRNCSNAPRSQRVLRLASLWCGRRGNRWLQAPGDLGEEPGLAAAAEQVPDQGNRQQFGVAAGRSRSRPGRDRDRADQHQVVDQRVDVDEQIFSRET